MSTTALDATHEILGLDSIDSEKIDLLARAVETADGHGITPSAAARTATVLARDVVDEVTTEDAHRLLPMLVRGRYVHTTGNGSRTRYHAGRAR